MKTILLLGGFGFIGSNVLRYIDKFLADEYNVVVFDKVSQHPFGEKFDCVKAVFSGDFSDSTLIPSMLEKHQIDYVFHFISSTVPATSNNMRFDIESNLVPTVEALEWLVKAKVKNIIYLSSGGAIYGNSANENSETDDTVPISSYGIVKLSIEKYLLMFQGQYGIQPLILRLSNPYGPLHYSTKQGVVNVALRHALEKKVFTIWGNGKGTKDYIYIDDIVEIMFLLIKLEIKNKIVNIGSGEIKSVNEIVESISRIVPGFDFIHQEAKSFDVSNSKLNIDKLLEILGNFQFTSFTDGLNKTLDWLESKPD